MADEKPTLHIDNDWKRQAQEEKRRLAEQEQKRREEEEERRRAAAPAMPPVGGSAGLGMPPEMGGTGVGSGAMPGASPAAGRAAGRAAARAGEPQANFSTLVQSILTQILFYLGELAPRGTEPQLNLDMAKHQIDMLGVIEETTRGNLTEDEQRMLDSALYETRMRYVGVASQFATV